MIFNNSQFYPMSFGPKIYNKTSFVPMNNVLPYSEMGNISMDLNTYLSRFRNTINIAKPSE